MCMCTKLNLGMSMIIGVDLHISVDLSWFVDHHAETRVKKANQMIHAYDQRGVVTATTGVLVEPREHLMDRIDDTTPVEVFQESVQLVDAGQYTEPIVVTVAPFSGINHADNGTNVLHELQECAGI